MLLENVNNVPPKQLAVNVSFIAYQNEEPLESSEGNAKTSKIKSLPTDRIPTESNILMVVEPFPKKWSKKDIANSRQELYLKKENQTKCHN